MADGPDVGKAPDGARTKERRLEGWGEIALYLRREIRTVQRWERTLGLPIHRLPVGKQSAVYAYPSELNRWYHERELKIRDEENQHSANATSPAEAKEQEIPATPTRLPTTDAAKPAA